MTNPVGGPILIVEDDRNIAALIQRYLENAGFQTLIATDGREALSAARRQPPGFVVLDLLLPEIDGWQVARELRRSSDVPILILTAQRDEIDRVAGFTLGADDYVVKPFSPRELVERVKAILRRSVPKPPRDDAATVLRGGGLELDAARHRITRDGRDLALTHFEFRLLKVLMSAPHRVLSRDALIELIYNRDTEVVDRVIDVHVGKLRQKIERDPSAPVLIRTVRGVGYSFDAEVETHINAL